MIGVEERLREMSQVGRVALAINQSFLRTAVGA